MTELMARPHSGDRDDSNGRQTKVGLHGHPLQNNMARAAIAEAIGTFVLVLTIVTTVIAAGLSKAIAGPPYGSIAIPVAGGVSLALVVASLGHVSGAHLNPAVTFGLAVNRRFPWSYVPVYLTAQFGGAVGAALVAWALYGDRARTLLSLGATYPGAGEPVWRALFAEIVVTFVLVLVVISVATDRRVPAGVAAIAIGAALAAAILISGPVSSAGVNPARALGPMIVSGKFTDWWVYVVAPPLGGILASVVYDRVLRRGNSPVRLTKA